MFTFKISKVSTLLRLASLSIIKNKIITETLPTELQEYIQKESVIQKSKISIENSKYLPSQIFENKNMWIVRYEPELSKSHFCIYRNIDRLIDPNIETCYKNVICFDDSNVVKISGQASITLINFGKGSYLEPITEPKSKPNNYDIYFVKDVVKIFYKQHMDITYEIPFTLNEDPEYITMIQILKKIFTRGSQISKIRKFLINYPNMNNKIVEYMKDYSKFYMEFIVAAHKNKFETNFEEFKNHLPKHLQDWHDSLWEEDQLTMRVKFQDIHHLYFFDRYDDIKEPTRCVHHFDFYTWYNKLADEDQ